VKGASWEVDDMARAAQKFAEIHLSRDGSANARYSNIFVLDRCHSMASGPVLPH
jgi:hypothetical protein